MESPKFNFKLDTLPDELTVRQGCAPDIFQYEGFRYTADTLDSFAKLVSAKAVKENCVVFCNEKGFHAILDDTVQDRKQDTVSYGFSLSVQAEEWKEVFSKGKVFDIKRLVDFLKRREENEIADIDRLLHAVSNFKYVTNVQGDFSFDDRNNYTFNVKLSDGEGTVRIPKVITANIEILNGSDSRQDIEIEVEVERPKDPSERPCFLLSCPKYPRYYKAAIDRESTLLPEQLPGYLIVRGSC